MDFKHETFRSANDSNSMFMALVKDHEVFHWYFETTLTCKTSKCGGFKGTFRIACVTLRLFADLWYLVGEQPGHFHSIGKGVGRSLAASLISPSSPLSDSTNVDGSEIR